MSDATNSEASSSSASKTSSKSPYEDSLLEHAYDGIKEYDNPLPRWWVNMFWLSFAFALLYFFHYQLSGKGTSVEEAYAQDVAAFEAVEAKRALKETVSEASLAKLAANSTAVAGGREVFGAQCKACHSDKGQGLIGPNLTDDHWIHGQGMLMDIYQSINQGVLAKGMPAWGRQLSPTQLRQVVAFVASIRDTNVPGKAPEGTRVDPASRGVGSKDSAGTVAPDAGASTELSKPVAPALSSRPASSVPVR